MQLSLLRGIHFNQSRFEPRTPIRNFPMTPPSAAVQRFCMPMPQPALHEKKEGSVLERRRPSKNGIDSRASQVERLGGKAHFCFTRKPQGCMAPKRLQTRAMQTAKKSAPACIIYASTRWDFAWYVSELGAHTKERLNPCGCLIFSRLPFSPCVRFEKPSEQKPHRSPRACPTSRRPVISDGQSQGCKAMRYSLVSREAANPRALGGGALGAWGTGAPFRLGNPKKQRSTGPKEKWIGGSLSEWLFFERYWGCDLKGKRCGKAWHVHSVKVRQFFSICTTHANHHGHCGALSMHNTSEGSM